MIRHTVLVRFRDDVSAETKADLMQQLAALRGHLSGITDFRWGANVSPEEPVIHGFRDGFYFDFVDAAARDAYLVDPAHQAAGARLVSNTAGGPEGVVVFDLEV